ncbi:G-patch domain and KOW motifs-containing protein [Acomys russatus]|uniref:G-patch domain and KOW motifs-containing protein n=1 Tax=Acomys russatus TaxID=60746 RepID=UPI0021E22D68|nr:G-patch domain and KOW motifs-containing protein [Acomys russatus]
MADPENLQPAGASTAPISFCFTRTSARRRLADPRDSEGPVSEEKDFLKSVEGRELHSVNPTEAPKELAIPLIQDGSRRQQLSKNPKPSSETSTGLMSDGVLSLAVKELIEESKKSLEERENAGVDPTLTIPMIQKGEGTDSDAQAEPVPEEADYETVPVEAYALALLQGMGWKPDKGIGNTFSQVVKPRINSLRPKGLGLGANLREAQALASSASHHPPRPHGDREKKKKGGDREKEDQPQGLVPGGAVLILSGPHRGLYGKIEGLDPDNVRAMVRLAAGNCIMTVSEYCLRPVSQKEFDSHASQPGHVSKTSTEQHNRTTGTALSLKALQNQEDSKKRHKDSERKREHPPDRQDGPVAKSEKAAPKNKHWLHRDLRVRFIDKVHKGGRYYNTKMTIEDVLSPDTCVCRTDEGRVLEGVRENMLETLIPKGEGHRVMVVLGPHAGKVGLLLSRDRMQSQALVQLRRENRVVELHYDAICQYVGPSDSDED